MRVAKEFIENLHLLGTALYLKIFNVNIFVIVRSGCKIMTPIIHIEFI